MAFAGINYLAVLAAGAAGFVFGAIYYTALGKPWMAAADLNPDNIDRANPVPYITAAVAQLVIAYMLAGILGHLGDVTIRGALITAFFIWLGFIVTTMAVNHRFQGAKPMLTVIDCGHWLGVLLVMGMVISLIGV
jgi:hypothetical protein